VKELPEQKILNQLGKALSGAVLESLGKKKRAAVVYSGGIDSSLVAFLAHQAGAQVTTFTVGWPESPDVLFVNLVEQQLPFKSRVLKTTKKDLKAALPEVLKLLEKAVIDKNLMQVSLATGLFLVLREIKREGFRLVLSGQGADELFAGYFRALKIPLPEINVSCKKELARLLKSDACREKVIADHFGLTIKYPFLDPGVVDLAFKIPAGLKLKKEKGELGRKYILRKLGERLGLPEVVFKRPKGAFQYSSRIQREIRKLY
jgi:asparagine synthase (glutamine-hydrolysing)